VDVIDFSREHKALAAREEEFRGKHVIVVGDEIYPFENGEEGLRILARVRREHPHKISLVTYVMNEEDLILRDVCWLRSTLAI
jgi:hypothetical protein